MKIEKVREVKIALDEAKNRLLDIAERSVFDDYELEERTFYKIQRVYRELSELYEDLDIIEERLSRSQ